MADPHVPIEDRERDYKLAVNELERRAAIWLEKRAAGRVPPRHEAALDVAIAEARRARRRLTDTRKRESRVQEGQR